jgi:hypothetical protein
VTISFFFYQSCQIETGVCRENDTRRLAAAGEFTDWERPEVGLVHAAGSSEFIDPRLTPWDHAAITFGDDNANVALRLQAR